MNKNLFCKWYNPSEKVEEVRDTHISKINRKHIAREENRNHSWTRSSENEFTILG